MDVTSSTSQPWRLEGAGSISIYSPPQNLVIARFDRGVTRSVFSLLMLHSFMAGLYGIEAGHTLGQGRPRT
jgi:hypothetical protein